jgi:hypothetical protein
MPDGGAHDVARKAAVGRQWPMNDQLAKETGGERLGETRRIEGK